MTTTQRYSQLFDGDTQLMHLHAAKWPPVRGKHEAASEDGRRHQHRRSGSVHASTALWKVGKTRIELKFH